MKRLAASSIQSGIIVFVISAHGEESHLANINSDGTKVYDQMIVGYDGQTVSVNYLLSLLDNDALKGKTKLCFIQACRSIKNGDKAQQVDLGVTVGVWTCCKSVKQKSMTKKTTLCVTKQTTWDLKVKMRQTQEKGTPE
ncbi:hypothetical protein DPMN_114948 [Dreissena polymorpha]|uniref:Caspase family p20 domain-containing protein n=1 Tax=Dreissena polymorpha TaxID=45954 RepID=A0A9D4QS77_DREPO|nr:hypothetical protein DPMN_114948 [Dreissena polymorpha]